jgi:hypothetical protein
MAGFRCGVVFFRWKTHHGSTEGPYQKGVGSIEANHHQLLMLLESHLVDF